MKKITFILFFALTSFMANAQNLITNGDFETAGTLKRVTDFYDATIQGTNPTATAGDAVAAGQWVKRALDDAKATAVIVAAGGNATTPSCLNLKIATTNNAAYTNTLAMLAVQKLTGLDNTKRYLVTFKAKQDATTTNTCHGVNVVLGDNVVKSLTAPLTVGAMLTGGTTLTQYTVVLDIPKYIASNPTADFSTGAVFGFAITVKATTNAAGVIIDDVVMTELTTPTIAYVKPVATGTGDGLSWANASADIAAMIAALPYGEVRVAAGTYTPTATLVLKEGVNLMGGYAADGSGTRDIWNNKTILDGAGDKRILMNNNAGNPFKYTTKVDGFILQNGYSDLGSAASLSLGAVLENCIIRNNTGTTFGAAVYFKRNTSVSGSGYSSNYQASGSLINCLIINNTSAGGAGAVYGESTSLFGLINCVIANNTCSEATTGIGGVSVGNSAHWSHIQNCILYNNNGAITNFKCYNNTAMFAVLNNWFDNSTLPFVATADTRSICGNNLTNATANTPNFELPTSFQGATTDPVKLAEYETCNWRLKSTSGLIGLGNATQNLRVPYENINAILLKTDGGRAYTDIATDIMGSSRVINSTVEMGVYEYNPVVVTAVSNNTTNGTVDGSITVSKGTSVTLTSSPASGQKLIKWNDGVSDVSTAAVYTFVPMADVTVTATFDANTGLTKNIQDNFVTVDGRNLTIKGEGSIEVYSVLGKLVLKQEVNGSAISLSNAGVYLVKINAANNTKIQKIVVR